MILQQSMKLGKVPPKIADAPELRMGLELFYGAFFDLIGCRSGWGDGPIQYNAIMDYARHHEFDAEQTDDLVFYLSQLDEVYLKHVKKKAPKGGSKPAGKK